MKNKPIAKIGKLSHNKVQAILKQSPARVLGDIIFFATAPENNNHTIVHWGFIIY